MTGRHIIHLIVLSLLYVFNSDFLLADINFDRKVKEFRLQTGQYISPAGERKIHFLSFSPDIRSKAVPLVVCFGGSGEMGDDMQAMFRQTTIFSEITGREFQKRHPCYLYVPQLPKDFSIHSGVPSQPNKDCAILSDAINQFISRANKPKIDTNRLYLTGLSMGGSIAFELPAYYPGRFAASIPVSTFMNEKMVPEVNACSYWLLCNKTSFMRSSKKLALAKLEKRLKSCGGMLKVSTFSDSGHNAWDRAWSEMAVWDWLFSFSLENVLSNNQKCKSGYAISVVGCYSNVRAIDENGISANNVIDGLRHTFFVSEGDAPDGTFWMCELPKRDKGRWVVEADAERRFGHLCGLVVYISDDGTRWRRAGVIRKRDRRCEFVASMPFRFIKVEYDGVAKGRFFLRRVYRQG